MKRIKYRDGYKYQLSESYCEVVAIKPPEKIGNGRVTLDTDGLLTLTAGYAFDGASGPCPDWPSIMRGAAKHDGLYQLMRLGLLPQSYRYVADCILRDDCKADGLKWPLYHAVYEGVRFGGGPSAKPKNERKVLTAPK